MTPLETKPVVESRWQDPLAELGRVLSHCHWDLYLQTTSQDYLGLEICSRGNSRRKTHSNDTGFNFLWKPLNFFFHFYILLFLLLTLVPTPCVSKSLTMSWIRGFKSGLWGRMCPVHPIRSLLSLLLCCTAVETTRLSFTWEPQQRASLHSAMPARMARLSCKTTLCCWGAGHLCTADPPPHTRVQTQLVEPSLISRPQLHNKMSPIKPWISLCPDFILIAD